MDVNSKILEIPTPKGASPSERASRPQETKPSHAGGAKKNFASVLRTTQHREDQGRGQHCDVDDMEPRRVSKSETKPDQGTCVRDHTSSSGEIDGCGHGEKSKHLSQNKSDQPEDEDGRSRDMGAMQMDVPPELEPVVDQVAPSQGAPLPPPVLSANDQGQGVMEDALPPSSENNGTAGVSTAPLMEKEKPGESTTATTEETGQEMGQAPPLPQGITVSLAQQGQVVASPPTQDTSESPSPQPLNAIAEQAIKAIDHNTGEQSGTPTQGPHEEQAASVPTTTEGGEQVSNVPQELSRVDASGPQATRFVEQPVQQKQADAAAHPHRERTSPKSSPDAGGEGLAEKPIAIALHEGQAVSDSRQHSDWLWSNQGERQSASGERPWVSHAPMTPSQSDLQGDHSAQAMTVGNAASPQPRPVDSRPLSSASPASSLSAAHELEPFVPMMSRSVVFEIAEPDLGRIHIRVAMTNELVHTHLSSDRSDVGQFLLSGQDRLQSALQSNGLDMGQFRVDIDRQGAGRSFQQGPSQDQSRMWQNGAPHEAGHFERHDETSLSYAGRLNLVA